jgi:hypothetical protein
MVVSSSQRRPWLGICHDAIHARDAPGVSSEPGAALRGSPASKSNCWVARGRSAHQIRPAMARRAPWAIRSSRRPVCGSPIGRGHDNAREPGVSDIHEFWETGCSGPVSTARARPACSAPACVAVQRGPNKGGLKEKSSRCERSTLSDESCTRGATALGPWKHRPGLLEQDASRLRQVHTVAATLQQERPDHLLQPADLLAEGRLGDEG